MTVCSDNVLHARDTHQIPLSVHAPAVVFQNTSGLNESQHVPSPVHENFCDLVQAVYCEKMNYVVGE